MNNFHKIEAHLECMIATGYKILGELDKQDFEMRAVKKLMDKRDEQLEALNKASVSRSIFSVKQKDKLRNFFTRFFVLEKKINKKITKLSLDFSMSIKDIDLHKRAKKSYAGPAVTSKFLNAQVTG